MAGTWRLPLVLVLAWAGGIQQRGAAGTVIGIRRARLSLRLRGGGDAVRPAVLKKVASKVDALDPHEAKPDLKRHASRLVLNDADATNATNATTSRPQEAMAFRIDGREVTLSEKSLLRLSWHRMKCGHLRPNVPVCVCLCVWMHVYVVLSGCMCRQTFTFQSMNGMLPENSFQVTEAEYNSRVQGVSHRALESWISDSVCPHPPLCHCPQHDSQPGSGDPLIEVTKYWRPN